MLLKRQTNCNIHGLNSVQQCQISPARGSVTSWLIHGCGLRPGSSARAGAITVNRISWRAKLGGILIFVFLSTAFVACGGGGVSQNISRSDSGNSAPTGSASKGGSSASPATPHTITVQASPANGGTITSN